MKRTLVLLIATVLALSVVFATVGCVNVNVDATDEYDTQYVLYLGTNDKDTNEPVFAPDVCKQKAIEVLLDRFGGYTIQEANGGWKDGDKVYTEYTLVIYLSDTTLDDVHAACDELIRVFHQSSILIQANQTKTEFYSTAND